MMKTKNSDAGFEDMFGTWITKGSLVTWDGDFAARRRRYGKVTKIISCQKEWLGGRYEAVTHIRMRLQDERGKYTPEAGMITVPADLGLLISNEGSSAPWPRPRQRVNEGHEFPVLTRRAQTYRRVQPA